MFKKLKEKLVRESINGEGQTYKYVYNYNYTIEDLKRIEKAVVDEQEHWRKKKFKKENEKNVRN